VFGQAALALEELDALVDACATLFLELRLLHT
jgi:hypothetical protein